MSRIRKLVNFIFYLLLFVILPVRSNGQVKKTVDLLISGGTIITVNANMDVLQNSTIAVKDGEIVAIGKRDDIDTMYISATKIIADGKIVMPGLINTHTHAAMTLLRGYADDMVLDDWLQNKIWPAEAKIMNSESVKAGTLLAIAEMISAGVTCFNDMYLFEDDVAQTAKEANMRVVIGEGIMDYPTSDCKTPDEALAVTEKLINKYKDDPLVSVAIAPHSPYTCSKETLLKVKNLYDKYNVPIHIHLSETEKEVSDVLAMYQMRPLLFLDKIGILNEKTIAAHCICLNQEEINLLCEKKTGVAHCPTSNMKLAEKVAPVTPMLALKIKVSFGTDGASSNNNLSVLNEMKIGSLLQKITYANPTVMNAPTVVRMATIEAAKVLDLDSKTGSLEKGKCADIIIIDLSEPHVTPSFDPYSTILYSVEESDIETTIINGRVVMKNRSLLTIDKEKAVSEANKWAKLLRPTGIKAKGKYSGSTSFQLNQNYPNPFNPATRISYTIPNNSFVTLEVTNALGQIVSTLVNNEVAAGYHEMELNANGLPGGIYFYRIQAEGFTSVKKMVLLK